MSDVALGWAIVFTVEVGSTARLPLLLVRSVQKEKIRVIYDLNFEGQDEVPRES